MGRKGDWGGREAGAAGRLGRKGAWGGRESGAEGSMGRKGVWGGREAGAAPLPEGFSAGFSPLIRHWYVPARETRGKEDAASESWVAGDAALTLSASRMRLKRYR